jgi:hypothetical protein
MSGSYKSFPPKRVVGQLFREEWRKLLMEAKTARVVELRMMMEGI